MTSGLAAWMTSQQMAANSGSDTELRRYCVTLADGSTQWFHAWDAHEADGHLKVIDLQGALLACFAPGSWVKVLAGAPND